MATTIEKVKKLFALAGNNPSKKEAEAAMLKAQELMSKEGLSMADVSSTPKDSKTVEFGSIVPDGGTIPKWQKIVMPVICENFRCERVLDRKFKGYSNGKAKYQWEWQIIGLKEDVEVCESVINFVFEYFWKSWKSFYRGWKKDEANALQHAKHGRGAAPLLRMDFAFKFADGLRHVFSEQCAEKGLVIVPDAKVKEVVASMNLKKVHTNTNSMGNAAAQAAGFKAGKMAKKDKYVS